MILHWSLQRLKKGVKVDRKSGSYGSGCLTGPISLAFNYPIELEFKRFTHDRLIFHIIRLWLPYIYILTKLIKLNRFSDPSLVFSFFYFLKNPAVVLNNFFSHVWKYLVGPAMLCRPSMQVCSSHFS